MHVRPVRIGFIWYFLATALALPLLASINLASAQSGPTVVIQGDTTVANGSTFTVDIVVQPEASLPIGVVQAYLEFDESYLQVVGGTHPSGPLIPGPAFDSTWGDIILNAADNNTGEISFAGGKGPAGSDVQTAFVLARVQFQAISETPAGSGTQLIFNVSVPQRTRAVSGITDVTSTVFGTTIHVVNNAAPIANDEGYDVIQGVTLNADANSGVLANDTDPDGGPLNAVLVSGVANGSLTLNNDGSFSYTHDPGFAGVDSFTYRANDGISSSNVATATITVLLAVDVPFAVDMQGRPAPPDASWVLGFTIDLYAPGAVPPADSPLYSYTATTDPYGTFDLSVPLGFYDVRVKGADTLRVLLPNVDLTSTPPTPVSLGTQISGDSNGDNVVDGNDYSDVQTAFGSMVSSLPPNLQGTDHNGDTFIDTIDYSLVVSNFGQPGAPP